MTGFAVMQDDTVLCAECVDELRAEGLAECAVTIVHAWLTDPAGQVCGCCGATDDPDRLDGVRS